MISIPIPLAGYDELQIFRNEEFGISIPIPLAGYDDGFMKLDENTQISIPIPLAGYDPSCLPAEGHFLYFNPHTPRGV